MISDVAYSFSPKHAAMTLATPAFNAFDTAATFLCLMNLCPQLCDSSTSDRKRCSQCVSKSTVPTVMSFCGRWSVGILLYEMLCGMPPFRAKSRNQLQKQILGGKLKLPRKPLIHFSCILNNCSAASTDSERHKCRIPRGPCPERC